MMQQRVCPLRPPSQLPANGIMSMMIIKAIFIAIQSSLLSGSLWMVIMKGDAVVTEDQEGSHCCRPFGLLTVPSSERDYAIEASPRFFLFTFKYFSALVNFPLNENTRGTFFRSSSRIYCWFSIWRHDLTAQNETAPWIWEEVNSYICIYIRASLHSTSPLFEERNVGIFSFNFLIEINEMSYLCKFSSSGEKNTQM